MFDRKDTTLIFLSKIPYSPATIGTKAHKAEDLIKLHDTLSRRTPRTYPVISHIEKKYFFLSVSHARAV